MNIISKTNCWKIKFGFVIGCCGYLSTMVFFVLALSNPFDIPIPSENPMELEIAFYGDAFSILNDDDVVFENIIQMPPAQKQKRILHSPKIPASIRGKKAEKILHPIIVQTANQYEIDPALIKSIIWAESSFNPNAVSNKGALGLMQLMPATAKSLGVEDCLNPESNIDAGVRYFKQLMVRFQGDAELALAAYNAGTRKVLKYNGIPPFEATRFYVKKVFEYYESYKKDPSEDFEKI